MTIPPSIPVILFAAADAMARHGLPLPKSAAASVRFGLELDIATHVELRRWAEHMGLPPKTWLSQPYNRGDVPETLTNIYGTWCGFKVRLSCCEPITTDVENGVAR